MLLTVAYLLGQAVFEIRQLFCLATDPNEPTEDYMKLVVQFATRLMALLVQIESLMYGESEVEFANHVLQSNKKFKGSLTCFWAKVFHFVNNKVFAK